MKKTLFTLLTLLSLVFPAVAADNEDRRIIVRNFTHRRIVALMASPIDQGSYTYNMIRGPADWIRSGQQTVADIDDGTGYCRYDIKAVFSNGDSVEHYNVNVCWRQEKGQSPVVWTISE